MLTYAETEALVDDLMGQYPTECEAYRQAVLRERAKAVNWLVGQVMQRTSCLDAVAVEACMMRRLTKGNNGIAESNTPLQSVG